MEFEGIRVDMDSERIFTKSLKGSRPRKPMYTGKPGSASIFHPKTMGGRLFDKLKLDPKAKTKTGQYARGRCVVETRAPE
jgi:hypothetical protein